MRFGDNGMPLQDDGAAAIDKEIRKLTKALMSEHPGMKYRDALKQVFADDPKLHQVYLVAHGSFVPQ